MSLGSNKEKVYVDFIGTHAAGKSTIKRELHRTLERGNKEVFKIKTGRAGIKKTLLFLVIKPRKFFSIMRSWKVLSKNKRKVSARRRMINSNFYFYFFKQEIYLDESFLHIEMNRISCENEFKKLLNFLPDEQKVFVFVDVRPEVSFKRYIKRTKKEGKEMNKSLNDFKNQYKNHKVFFNFFKQNERKHGVKKVIKVNGEKPVEENVDLIIREAI